MKHHYDVTNINKKHATSSQNSFIILKMVRMGKNSTYWSRRGWCTELIDVPPTTLTDDYLVTTGI